MRYSVGIPTCKEGLNFPAPFAGPEDIIEIIQKAEELGFHSVWGNDHITAPKYVREAFDAPPNFYEPLITLAYAAAKTSRIKLAPSVIVLPMREPVYLAKQVATLDAFSSGRFILGVGVGAYREEFERIHPRLAKTARRGVMVDEALEALVRLFTEPVASFDGNYYCFDGIALSPKPVQDPFPIYVGGNSKNAAQRAGTYGMGWLPAALSATDIRRGIEVLHEAAQAAGRDPESIDVAPQLMVTMGQTYEEAIERFKNSQMYHHLISLSSSTLRNQDLSRIEENNLVGTPEQILAKIEKLDRAGVTHCAALNFISNTPDEMMEQMKFFQEAVINVYEGAA
jgi:probable F420-dependent oxidoreductase